jgi:GNAT superfamily N-acetyltransferase
VPSQSVEEVFFAPDPVHEVDRKTSLHDGEEAYVKLGRLCVVKEERGRRVADLLIQGALEWARENAGEVRRICGVGAEGEGKWEWKGLICVHAQEGAVRAWERNGFVVDEGMGEWLEAEKKHVGMWRRVDVGGE